MLCLGIKTRQIAVTTSGAWKIDMGQGHAHQCVRTVRFATLIGRTSTQLVSARSGTSGSSIDAFSQGQSTDAAPLSELFDFYTLLHIYSDCATGFTLIWTFCITFRDNISGEEFTRHCSDFSVCQTMDGAALVDDRSGVTFRAELCIPWDAPEAVVDIDSAELVSLGSFPDKVGLFGRRKDAAVRRILRGQDSRSVRFLVPDTRGVDCSYHDVTVVDM